MMNNDNKHLNKSSNQFNYSMPNINNSMNQNDEGCIDLLEMINMDDNTSNILESCNMNQGNIIDVVESKDEERFKQDIMSALEKKDLKKIVTLALSQSHGGQKMGVILNQTMLAIEKSSNNSDDNVFEKLSNIIRAQPKNSSSVLRATVAPIRNESIVSNSSTSIGNYATVPNIPGSKSSSQVSRCSVQQEFSDQEWQALLSPDVKSETIGKSHGSRSLPATPPVSQVPSRPLSSSCVPYKNNEQGYQTYQTPGPNGSMSFVQINNQAGPMMLHGGYGGGHMSQGVHNNPMQFQQNLFGNNGIVCIVSPSMTGDHVQQTTGTNYPFMVPQNVLISVSNGVNSSQSCQSVATTCPMIGGPSDCTKTSLMPATTTPIISSSAHCSNLTRILPKPGNRIIAPKTQYSQQYVQQSSVQTVQTQQFKRPTVNRRTNVRPKTTKKTSKAKDNIMMAWEIAEQSLPSDDQASVSHSFLTQLESDELQMMTGPDNDGSESILRGSIDSNYNVMDSLDQYDHHNDVFAQYDPSLDSGHNAHNNIFANFEEMIKELSEMQYASVTVCDRSVMIGVCTETSVEYGRVHVMCAAPLVRATVTRAVIPSIGAVVVSRPNVAHVSNEKPLDTVHWSNASNNSRMVQLLYAHLGPHSDLLSPLLKCLLPPQQSTSTTSTTVNDIQELTEPLSVSTRISEQDDLMNEEDLLADISPVKRDPFHLANLDRLLESCQPPSSVSSVASNNNQVEHQFLGRLPRIPFTDHEDPPLSLHSLINTAGATNHYLPWLKRGKHKNKWTHKDSFVRSTRSIEVPSMISDAHMSRLRKKSNYREMKRGHGPIMTAMRDKNIKYHKRIARLRHNNQQRRLQPQQLPPEREEHKEGQLQVENAGSTVTGGILKIRIHLSKPDPIVAPNTVAPLQLPMKIIMKPELDLSVDTDLSSMTPKLKRHRSHKKSSIPKSKPRLTRSRSGPRQELSTILSDQGKNNGDSNNTKRIFCTRKEDRRSSVLHAQISGTSPIKQRHSPTKKKRTKLSVPENPPIIMKLSSKKSEPLSESICPVFVEEETSTQTGDTIKLFFKRSGQNTYKSKILAIDPGSSVINSICEQASIVTTKTVAAVKNEEGEEDEEEAYEYCQAVNLAPPSQQRVRPQQAALQFSPAHSSSDSDICVAHNEISSLLQRQEQREPLADSNSIRETTFPSLPVPYLIGTDPSVFMDPHEVELVVVKNSRYKKVSQHSINESHHPTTNHTVTVPTAALNIFPDTSTSELFVPGCFVEQDNNPNIAWNRSSPSMPILAPQEPFTGAPDGSTKPSNTTHPCSYSQSVATQKQQSQSYSEQSSDRTQHSPLCMTTNNGHNSQYSSSNTQLELMPPDPIKSPSYRHPNYHYQNNYNSSCYLGDSNTQSMIQPTIMSSKSQMQSPGLPPPPQQQQQISVSSACSSQLQDYAYFHNSSQQSLQSLTETYATPSSYQSGPDPTISSQPSKQSSSMSKRSSSSSRNQSSEQQSSSSSSSKKRKESMSVSNPLSMYPSMNNSDLYSAAAAAQYSQGLDSYYGSGFSNILGNMDQLKLYEQYAREYSLQMGSFCGPGAMPWNSAMMEYCKQAAVGARNPGSVVASAGVTGGGSLAGTTSPGPGFPNPLSLAASGLHHQSSGDYANPYSAYAMSQPYSMYSSFGLPK